MPMGMPMRGITISGFSIGCQIFNALDSQHRQVSALRSSKLMQEELEHTGVDSHLCRESCR
jgi:hypothetical protein